MLLLATSVVAADDGINVVASTPTPHDYDQATKSLGEVGLFFGGFISNYYHQFYDTSKFPGLTRPELRRVSPEFGVRYAYYVHPNWGIEAELSMITATTKGMNVDGTGPDNAAKIWNARAQLVFQYPLANGLVPFATAGFGTMHTTSDLLGISTHFPVHVGAGARFWITDSVAVRIDGRYLRGPS